MSRTSIVPTFRYRDADAAIDFLKKAFGFREHALYRDDEDAVAHAELRFGDALVMLGAQRDDELRTRNPRDVGGVTSSPYMVVEDLADHYERARAAGAEIVIPLRSTEYGSREYSARDPEGHLWHFGTYDPFDPPADA